MTVAVSVAVSGAVTATVSGAVTGSVTVTVHPQALLVSKEEIYVYPNNPSGWDRRSRWIVENPVENLLRRSCRRSRA